MKVIFRGRRAVFSGEVGASLFVAGAAFVKFWQIAGARNVVFFHTKCISKMGRVRSPKRRVRDDDFILASWSECSRIVFILAEAIQGFSDETLN